MNTTENREFFAHSMEVMNDGMQACFDVGRKTQDAWFSTVSQFFSGEPMTFGRPVNFDKVGEKWMPFMAKTSRVMVDCVDAQMKSGMQAARTAFECTFEPKEDDIYRTARVAWDAAFDAARDNVKTFANAAKISAENWRECFAECTRPAAKPAPKPGK